MEEVIPSQELVRNICQELIHIQVNTIIGAYAEEFKSRATVVAWKTYPERTTLLKYFMVIPSCWLCASETKYYITIFLRTVLN